MERNGIIELKASFIATGNGRIFPKRRKEKHTPRKAVRFRCIFPRQGKSFGRLPNACAVRPKA